MEVETLSPFTPPPEQPDKTPVRHKRKRPATATPTTTASVRKPHPTSSIRSPLITPPCPPPPTSTSLLSLPPRCPTPSCPHHGGLQALCTEWLYGTQYVLTCPGCQAIIYPCDGCHQVAAHPAASTLYSACSECGFLTLINPQLRRLLRLPPLLPLSSSTTLSIQSSISLQLYLEHRTAAYQSAFTAYRRAEQSHRHQRADEAKDGGESDTTDHAIRPAQPTVSSAKKRKKADTVLPKAGESTLLRLREELLAIGQLSSAQRLAPPSFRYGVQPLDSVPFTSHHLQSLHTTLLSLHSTLSSSSLSSSSTAASAVGSLSSSSLSSFHAAATSFFSARAGLMSCIQKVRQGWTVLQRVQRTYAELEAEETNNSHPTTNQLSNKLQSADMHTDDEVEEQDEHRADRAAAHPAAPVVGAAVTHSKAVQRGVMGIVENVMSCRLQHTCNELHTRAAPHLPLLSTINTLLLPLYTDLHSTLASRRKLAAATDVPCMEQCDGEMEAVDGLGADVLDGRVELLLWCCWLLRCCYCGVSSVLQRAVYWSNIVNVARPAAVEVGTDKRAEKDAAEVEVATAQAAEVMRRPHDGRTV